MRLRWRQVLTSLSWMRCAAVLPPLPARKVPFEFLHRATSEKHLLDRKGSLAVARVAAGRHLTHGCRQEHPPQ